MAKSDRVPHDDFHEGFVVGYQLVRGTNAGIPGTPGQPGTTGISTPFIDGIKAGISAAGQKIVPK